MDELYGWRKAKSISEGEDNSNTNILSQITENRQRERTASMTCATLTEDPAFTCAESQGRGANLCLQNCSETIQMIKLQKWRIIPVSGARRGVGANWERTGMVKKRGAVWGIFVVI